MRRLQNPRLQSKQFTPHPPCPGGSHSATLFAGVRRFFSQTCWLGGCGGWLAARIFWGGRSCLCGWVCGRGMRRNLTAPHRRILCACIKRDKQRAGAKKEGDRSEERDTIMRILPGPKECEAMLCCGDKRKRNMDAYEKH